MFRDAATALPDYSNSEQYWPKYALLTHAIELSLKAFADYSVATGKPPGKEPKQHDLSGWYQLALPSTDFIGVEILPAQPELPLRQAACKDHIGKAFDLTPNRLVRSFPDPRRAIGRTARHRDQDVRIRYRSEPRAVAGN